MIETKLFEIYKYYFHDELKGLLSEGNTNDTMIIPLLKEEINLSTLELGRLKTRQGKKK